MLPEHIEGLEGPEPDKPEPLIEAVFRLAELNLLEYDQAREEEAKKLNVRVGTLDKEVAKLRRDLEAENGQSDLVESVEPWPDPVEGIEVLNEIISLLYRHVILPEGAIHAIALWIMGTYCYDCFRIWPKLLITSPEKRCGKSTLMATIGALCHRPLIASNISPAAIYRVIEAWRPSLLIDEADTFVNGNDELRGVLNSGHTKSAAFVVRVTGDDLTPAKFSTWSPMVIGMIKMPPDTIVDRSIVIQLRRKLPGEFTTKLPLSFDNDCYSIRQKLARWSEDYAEDLKRSRPILPPSHNDRALDNWTPLFAIAEIIGGDWLDQVKTSFTLLTLTDDDEESIGPLILSDIQTVFNEKRAERIFSSDLIEALIDLEERPWSEWRRGKPLTGAGLSRLLKPFRIKSQTIRIGNITQKGYYKKSFQDAFNRYLSPTPPIQSVTTSQAMDDAACRPNSKRHKSEMLPFENPLQPTAGSGCDVVTDENNPLEGDDSKLEEF